LHNNLTAHQFHRKFGQTIPHSKLGICIGKLAGTALRSAAKPTKSTTSRPGDRHSQWPLNPPQPGRAAYSADHQQKHLNMSSSIPSVQTAALIENPGDDARIVFRSDIPVGNPGVNEILVKLAFTGVW
jgi:hypothetical protein